MAKRRWPSPMRCSVAARAPATSSMPMTEMVVVGFAKRYRHEGQLPLMAEPINSRAPSRQNRMKPSTSALRDVPGQLFLVGQRDQRNAGAVRLGDLRDPGHQHARKRVGEEVGERLDGGDADGVDLAGAQQPPRRIGAIAELLGDLAHARLHLRAHHLRPVEDVGDRAGRDARRLGDVGELGGLSRSGGCHAPGPMPPRTYIASPVKPIQFSLDSASPGVLNRFNESIQSTWSMSRGADMMATIAITDVCWERPTLRLAVTMPGILWVFLRRRRERRLFARLSRLPAASHPRHGLRPGRGP